MAVATRGVTLRDFVIFQIKLLLDGGKDFVAFWLSIGAIVIDFIAGRGRRPRLFYSVIRLSERFDHWLNLHSVVDRIDESDDGFFGASDDDADTLLGEIERLVQRQDPLRPKKVRPREDQD